MPNYNQLLSATTEAAHSLAWCTEDPYYVQRGHLRQTPTVVGRNLTQSSKARSEVAILRITSVFVCVSYPPRVLYYLLQHTLLTDRESVGVIGVGTAHWEHVPSPNNFVQYQTYSLPPKHIFSCTSSLCPPNLSGWAYSMRSSLAGKWKCSGFTDTIRDIHLLPCKLTVTMKWHIA